MRRFEQKMRRHVLVDPNSCMKGVSYYYGRTVRNCSAITKSFPTIEKRFVGKYQRTFTTTENNTPNKDDNDETNDNTKESYGRIIVQQQEQNQISQDWIPPNRPLVGDIGNPYHIKSNYFVDEEEELRQLEIEIQKLEEEEKEEALRKQQLDEQQNKLFERMYQQGQPDWNKLRRSIFGTNTSKTNNVTVADPTTESNVDTEGDDNHDIITCKMYTLLSKNEIMKCLTVYGGQDIVLILDDFKNRRMGGAMGIIIVTANNIMQLRQLGDVLVRQLRKRMLQERGVVGAELGMEGDYKSKKKGMDYDDSLTNQKWCIVDCCNYIVHIQDEPTRKAINLEGLWSGSDPLFQIRDLRDEEIVDTYVSTYPIPDWYIVHSGYVSKRQQREQQTTINSSSGISLSSLIAGQKQLQQSSTKTTIDTASSSVSFAETINRLQKSRFTVSREPDKKMSSSAKHSTKRQKQKQVLNEKLQEMKRITG